MKFQAAEAAHTAISIRKPLRGESESQSQLLPPAKRHASGASSLLFNPTASVPSSTSTSILDGIHASHFTHDFCRVPLSRSDRGKTSAPGSVLEPGKKMVCAQTHPNSDSQSSGSTVHAISASGAGTIATTYAPEAKDKSSKIVFIQVMRESLDGAAVKPSLAAPSFAYQDADTTSDFYHVDYVSGENDPYYNGDDAGDFGTQGNATATPPVPASTTDTPNYHDGSFPAGTSKLLWEFKTAAFSAAGEDQGAYYGYSDWNYSKEQGKTASTTVTGTSAGDPGSKFDSAVKLWNSNHGFTMPSKGSSILGGILGGGLGAAAGVGLGFALGGPIGAIVGGLVGLVGGAFIGASAGKKPDGQN